MMNLSRASVAGWLFATALVALGLAPLAYLTDAGLTALMYLQFGALLAATFLARFGGPRRASWWFGFATFGWASILFHVPGLWNAVDNLGVAPGVDLADLSRSIGFWIAEQSGRLGSRIEYKLVGVVNFWFTICAAIAGGLLAQAVDRRRPPRNAPGGQVDPDRSSPQ